MLVLTVPITGGLLRGAVRSDPARPVAAAVTFAAVVRQPAFRAALASNFVNGWTVYGVRVALVPLFVVEVLHRPGSWSGIALAAFAAGTGATLLIGGRWADRPRAAAAHPRRLRDGGGHVAVDGPDAAGWRSWCVASLVSGVGTGLMSPAVNASVTDVIAAHGREVNSGSALAGFQMVGDVGAIIGPIVGRHDRRRGGLSRRSRRTAPLRSFPSLYGCVSSIPDCSDERTRSDLLHADLAIRRTHQRSCRSRRLPNGANDQRGIWTSSCSPPRIGTCSGSHPVTRVAVTHLRPSSRTMRLEVR